MKTMPTLLRVNAITPDAAAVAEAAAILRKGGLVAFPTETVYGLGADASNPEAIARLNQVKGRPPEKPYSLHVHALEQMRPFVQAVPPRAVTLMERFWPGPLTIILMSTEGKTVGFRLPDHPVAQAFLKACDVPVAAPSANRSGEQPPTDAQQVLKALDGTFDGLLDGGPTSHGRESTVVAVLNGTVEVRREGAISTEAIMATMKANGR